jgi:hypothetical protein
VLDIMRVADVVAVVEEMDTVLRHRVWFTTAYLSQVAGQGQRRTQRPSYHLYL